MKRTTAALFTVMMLPLTGCVFAVGTDDDETEALRDRVRALEKRVDRMENPATVVLESGRNATVYKVVDGKIIVGEPEKAEPPKEPK